MKNRQPRSDASKAPGRGDGRDSNTGNNPNNRGGGNPNNRGDRAPREGEREDKEELDERVIDIKRVAKVIKGGRRFAFRTVVVVGDGNGRIGIGIGKARAVPDSIRKGTDRARRQMVTVSKSGATIPHPVVAEYGGAKVLLKPASPGTGVIAGGGVRAVVEAAGIRDILTKSQGSNNLLNVAMATLQALELLRSPQQLASMLGKDAKDVKPFWERKRVTDVMAEKAAYAASKATETNNGE